MIPTRRSPVHLTVLLLLVVAGFGLWRAHAKAWDLGRRSPVLSFDAAQYALAARTLAEKGRLATTFALPIELARHPTPPWPLAVVQPGLVLWEALLEGITPRRLALGSRTIANLEMPYQREWLTLLLPFTCFLALAATLGLLSARILARAAPPISPLVRGAAATTVGLSFLLDPEAQHFATGGFTELPYTLGVVAAFAALAAGRASRRPLLFGLLLGVTGAFRGSMLWTMPVLAIAAAWSAPQARARVLLLTLAGYALPLVPWWFYKWKTFGHPGWDLSGLGLWDGVGGRTWFSLTHQPRMPELPSPIEAIGPLIGKLGRGAWHLGVALMEGLRGLWIGATVAWLVLARPSAPLRAAGWAVLVHGVVSVVAAALGAGWLRYLFPARVPLEALGLLATWALIAHMPATWLGSGGRRVVQVGVAALALFWGATQTGRGLAEARAAVSQRGLPSVSTLRDLGHAFHRSMARDEPVMSNLGPTLAWYARRPVVHLALTPEDVEACRERLPFRIVLLAFRDSDRAWEGWREILDRPDEAKLRPEWNVKAVRLGTTWEGFRIVWLELGPPRTRLASARRRAREWTEAGSGRY